jgi:hypothetical protein
MMPRSAETPALKTTALKVSLALPLGWQVGNTPTTDNPRTKTAQGGHSHSGLAKNPGAGPLFGPGFRPSP